MKRVGTHAAVLASAITTAAMAAALAGCGGRPAPLIDTVSDIDRSRAALLGADPILAGAIGEPHLTAGRLRSERVGWERTEARARLYEHAPPDVNREPAWQWVSFAYRVADGVSYWAQVSALLDQEVGGAWVDVLLRAPHERDVANLFPDAPKALPVGKSCVDDRADAKNLEQSGTLTYVRDWMPFPSQTRSPDPTKR